MEKKKFRITNKTRTNLYGLLFILPWLLGFLILFLNPIMETVIYSFQKITTEDHGLSRTFIGFDNYRFLFREYSYELNGQKMPFIRIMFESISGTLIELPIIIIFSLLVAILLNQKMRGRGIVRTIFFLPIIFGLPVLSHLTASSAMSDSLNETIKNQALFKYLDISFMFQRSGLPESVVGFMQNSIKGIFNIISFSGVQTLIFLSALQSVNPTLYEVAKIEGASSYETFWKITIPMIFPIIITAVVYTFVDVLYRSPITQVIQDAAFKDGTAGPGVSSAISVLFFILTTLLLVIIVFLLSRGGNKNEK